MDEPLQRILHTLQYAQDATKRYNAALQIGFLGNAQAAPVLSELMQHDEDWGIRQNAAWAAGQGQFVACVPALQAVLNKPGEDEQVRYVAGLALVRVNHANTIDDLQALTSSEEDAVRRVAAATIRAAVYLVQ